MHGYQRLFLDAGFSIVGYADESASLRELIGDLKRKLLAAGLGKALGAINGVELSLGAARRMLASAKELVDNGTVQYCRMLLSKGRPTHTAEEPAPKLNLHVLASPQAADATAPNDCGCEDGNC